LVVDRHTVPVYKSLRSSFVQMFETRGVTCSYAALPPALTTLGLSGLRAAPPAQRTARTSADSCALGSGSAAAVVDALAMRAERSQLPFMEQVRHELADSAVFLDPCGERV
jgi:hypothetical protein